MNGMRRNVLLLSGAQALTQTSSVLLLATSGLVGAALAPMPSLATLPAALQYVAVMATTFPASFLMRRFGRRPGFVLGALVGAAGAALAAAGVVAGDFAASCLGAVLFGVSNGFATYYRFAAIDVSTLAYQSRAVAYVLAGGVVAAIAGPNLASRSRTLLSSAEFAGSYLVMIGLMLAAALVASTLTIPRPRAEERRRGGRPLWEIARQPVFLVAAGGGVLGWGVMVLLMTATPLAMRDQMFPFSGTALVIQWHVLGMFAPSFVSGSLVRRWGVLRVMLAGGLLMALCVAVNLSFSGMAAYFAALLLLGVGWNFLFVGGTSLLTGAYGPEEKAKTQALNDFLVYTTTAVASLSAGALVVAVGWRGVNLAVIPFVAVILGLVLWLRDSTRGWVAPAPAKAIERLPGSSQI